MTQSLLPSSACRSVFRKSAEASTAERYTQLWITLINQMERDKQILSAAWVDESS